MHIHTRKHSWNILLIMFIVTNLIIYYIYSIIKPFHSASTEVLVGTLHDLRGNVPRIYTDNLSANDKTNSHIKLRGSKQKKSGEMTELKRRHILLIKDFFFGVERLMWRKAFSELFEREWSCIAKSGLRLLKFYCILH